jgi:hypothetical protein
MTELDRKRQVAIFTQHGLQVFIVIWMMNLILLVIYVMLLYSSKGLFRAYVFLYVYNIPNLKQ